MKKELYIGNIPFEATEDDLVNLFAVAGKVTSVHLITDRVSGKFRGCGYLRMASEREAREAAQLLDGAYLISRQITVSLATSKPPEPPGRKGPGRSGPARRRK